MRKDTKARAFSLEVKREIAARDSIDGWPCCLWCGAAAPEETAWSNAHFIGRAQGGLGVAENGLTLCPICHRRYDQTTDRPQMRAYFRGYLEDKYKEMGREWDESSLVYRKGAAP